MLIKSAKTFLYIVAGFYFTINVGILFYNISNFIKEVMP